MAEERCTTVEHGQAPAGQGAGQRVTLTAGGLVAIGEILRPHGRSGDIRVRPLTDRPERFAGLAECVVWDPTRDGRVTRRVERARRHGPVVLVKLAGVGDPDAARALAGQLIAVPEAQAVPLEPGRAYPWQLEGCRVETEDGAHVGAVVGVEQGPAQDLWVVADGEHRHLIPAVPAIVLAVDLVARRVVIRPPEGLLDL